MSIFDITSSTDGILVFDIFKMLGLDSLSQDEKDQYLQRFSTLIMEYFLIEKVGDRLTREQAQELMDKYPPTSDKNVEAFLQEVAEYVPDVGDLFTEALIEVKAKLVHDQYARRKERIEAQLAKESVPDKKEAYEEMLREVDQILTYIDEEQWGMVQWAHEEV